MQILTRSTTKVVVPVAILAVVAVAILLLICWWFPRAWAKGTAADRAEMDENKRRREAAEDTAVRSGGEADIELYNRAGADRGGDGKENCASAVGYAPPVTPY
ncbi:uncharacterized protein L3040_001656 [Drepanopeziza brunnea f. sp. 'multigermtubi']|uniref:Uncharacterized protein n=1 Tax=Marssonina brunnea f. sp. multigermtubi (strain MB_m1) TaxID=1072389 RepID=K1XRR3_MARBU|nr:uncharacterized protein MBM_06505 [Drepanopeziza brunnea f. sp. 'multigermtubi' MB_m1]EKD15289.1 hypothetical protein MBM_06505 [Drepanopeziza brunnea f. sp. 'multigermtubi' MB_m1]KAJ5051893.1 hypothetical protein L3040_001656 [Drepanopeziza brunnea f. sp. 'multigermtubi']